MRQILHHFTISIALNSDNYPCASVSIYIYIDVTAFNEQAVIVNDKLLDPILILDGGCLQWKLITSYEIYAVTRRKKCSKYIRWHFLSFSSETNFFRVNAAYRNKLLKQFKFIENPVYPVYETEWYVRNFVHKACTYASNTATDVLYAAERNGARTGPDAECLRSVPDTNVHPPAKTVSVNKPASVEAQSEKGEPCLVSLCCSFNSGIAQDGDLSVIESRLK